MIETHRTTLSLRALAMILLALSVLTAATPAAAATRYVNGSCGSNAWTGLSSVCAAPNGPKATIQVAINASSNGDEVVVADGTYSGGLDFNGKHITLRSANGPDNCIIDGTAFRYWSGAETTDTVVQGLTMTNGTGIPGGAVLIENAGGSFIDCVFSNNTSDRAAAIFHGGTGDLVLSGCRFTGNSATIAIGAVFRFGAGSIIVSDCVFTDNDGGEGPALACNTTSTQVVNCLFAGNTAAFLSAALVVVTPDNGVNIDRVTNCVFSRNSGQRGAAYINGIVGLANCSFSGNLTGGGLVYSGSQPIAVGNSVFWGNTPAQITSDGGLPGAPPPTVSFSNVGGGWFGPGSNNIDADPLFVQPGTDDLRLADGSPAIDAGANFLLPADELDLDGDGNTTEQIPVDRDGNTRIQSGTVDMGAYEGAYSSNDPAAGDNDLDQGGFAVLVPEGGPLDPVSSPAVLVLNTSGPDNASFVVTQIDWELHPGAGGFSELSSILQNETTLGDGQYRATQYISFGVLSGVNPQDVTLTSYDQATDTWVPAVSRNTVPEGNRIYSQDPKNWGVSMQTGDWGVFWNPSLQQGFAWANVDHESDFGMGVPIVTSCPADCEAIEDGEVGIVDFLAQLASWGQVIPGSRCELNGDEVIDLSDMAILIESWGPCVLQSSPAPGPSRKAWIAATRSADLDRDGRVGMSDLEILKASWGEARSRADLDRDGSVGARDLLNLLAQWSDD